MRQRVADNFIGGDMAGSIDEADRYRAPALDKGLDILELLAGTTEGLSQAEIAKALDRTPNEIYRMLDRLVRRDYVRRTSGDRYELTLKLFELAHMAPPIARLVGQSMPVMRNFVRDAQQAVHLVIHDRNVLVVVAQVDSPGYWNVSIRVGARIGMINTGSGHVFLAFASKEERQFMLEDPTTRKMEILSADIENRLALVREQGHEAMRSHQVAGVINLSVPIFDSLGNVIAALTCPYTQRLDDNDAPGQDEALALLRSAGREINDRHRVSAA
jgi:DNA-binding IclR family transcriptional regulator